MTDTSMTPGARQAAQSTTLDRLVRLGIVSYGVVHLLLAWLALQLAFGSAKTDVSKTGALRELAKQPGGTALLWALALGFAALVAWQVVELVGARHRNGPRRWKAIGVAVLKVGIYGTLGYSAAKLALGEKSSGESTDGYTATVMSWPFGPLLVGAVGVGVIGYAVHQVIIGITDQWEDKVAPDATTGSRGRLVSFLARAGYPSRGVAFGIIGGLFVWAALTQDPRKSGGLDAALGTLSQSGAGTVLLVMVALGLGCFGLFCFAWARHFRDA